jgi:nicotinamide riboside transporter PnuC
MAHYLCLFRLEDMQGMITAGFIASALSAGCLKFGSKHHQPGLAWVSLWFLVVSVCISLNVDHLGALASVLLMLFPACWLWHRQPKDLKQSGSVDFTYQPALPAWLFSLAIPCFIWQIAVESSAAGQVPYLTIQSCAFALALVAMLIRCERLTISSAILSLFTLHLLVYESDRGVNIFQKSQAKLPASYFV